MAAEFKDEIKTNDINPIPVSFIATYPPRHCGIATYTCDLVTALAHLYKKSLTTYEGLQVIALNDRPQGYHFPEEVRFEIREQHANDYREASEFLNLSDTEVVNVQHEFGIFGGEYGNYILQLLSRLNKPIVTTFHSILHNPSPDQLKIVKLISSYSTLIVVHSRKAVEFLSEIYNIPEDKIVIIPHGVPEVPFLDPAFYKDEIDAEGKQVILTFGLINPGKGIEVMIQALPKVVKECPEVLYIILGATHPKVKEQFGEEYRFKLERMVDKLNLRKHVIFYNRYVSLEELVRFLVAADILVTPYLSKEQIVSGVLSYGLGCGKAIVSTPYWYAEELLSDQRGILVPFGDSDALSEQIIELLNHEVKRHRLRKNAYQLGKQMVWSAVAKQYHAVFKRAIEEYSSLRVRARIYRTARAERIIPEVNLSHLKAMTDDTGLYQHAIYTTPNRFLGYTTDDNARAAIVTVLNYKLFKDESVLPLLYIYLSFLHYSVNEETNRVRNFLSYERKWLEKEGSEDSHGRVIWSLGITVADAPTESTLRFATRLFDQLLPVTQSFISPRAIAYVILGCFSYLNRFSGDRKVQDIMKSLAQRLLNQFLTNQSEKDNWFWCEDILTYDNARLAQALILAGKWFQDSHMLEQGLKSLSWLLYNQTNKKDGYISLIGNRGWWQRGKEKAQFDQQPVDATALVEACYSAYQVTEDEKWQSDIIRCFEWFLGKNDLQEPLYDFSTGGCQDGLHPTGVNQNQGGESTVCWLIALHRMYELSSAERTKAEI